MKPERVPILLLIALSVVLVLSVSLGSVHIPIRAVLSLLSGHQDGLPEAWSTIVLVIRLPRVLSAALVGGMLAVGGVTCQGVFGNPLAEPYLLGISSGAALGATMAIVFFPAGRLLGLGTVSLFAFAGAMIVTMGVFILAGRRAFHLPSTILLSGVAVAFLCQSVIWLLMSLNRDQLERITFWILGSLSGADWHSTAWLAAISLASAAVLIVLGRFMDILSTGAENAHSLGLEPGRAAALVLTLTALGTASAVAVAGSIGFIGLVIPHIMRFLTGPPHGRLAFSSWLGGAALLVAADLVARTIIAPGEIPVGVVTAVAGAPFLLILAMKRRVSS